MKELQGSDSDASDSKSLLGLVSKRREQGLGESMRSRVTVPKGLPLVTAYTWAITKDNTAYCIVCHEKKLGQGNHQHINLKERSLLLPWLPCECPEVLRGQLLWAPQEHHLDLGGHRLCVHVCMCVCDH